MSRTPLGLRYVPEISLIRKPLPPPFPLRRLANPNASPTPAGGEAAVKKKKAKSSSGASSPLPDAAPPQTPRRRALRGSLPSTFRVPSNSSTLPFGSGRLRALQPRTPWSPNSRFRYLTLGLLNQLRPKGPSHEALG